MPTLAMRLRLAESGAAARLRALRDQLGSQANVVSARGRELTLKVFGEALPPARAVERICADVCTRGLEALLYYTEQFDRVRLTPQTIRVNRRELADAWARADPEFLETIRAVRRNVMAFQTGLLTSDAVLQVVGSHELRLRYRPMRRVGILVPGGAAAYPSTLLMTVGPAQAAGVREIAVVMPPTPNGANNPDLLAVCHELGVTEVYRVGGAQAVAALAYGVDGIKPVDMIVGPGNAFVALAKRHVYGQVAIDCVAGPSEIVILADDSANPEHVAADLIAQAEHSPGASVLITWHEPLIDAVVRALERQLAALDRGCLARESLECYGALVLVRDPEEAVACANDLAPEHLHIATRDAESLGEQCLNAGAIFLGHHTPVAVGDYVAGPSHVLPTGGTARFAAGLAANDFLKRTSILHFSPAGLARVAPHVVRLAEKEGLTGHAASVTVRLTPSAETTGLRR